MTTLTPEQLEQERQALLTKHQQDRDAHFNKDVAALVATMIDGQLSVRDGKVSTGTRAGAQARFQNYFAQVDKFLHWDDVIAPTVQVAADGSMAWMVNQIRLHYIAHDATETDVVCAWLVVYEKTAAGQWTAVANASTFDLSA